ncbi:MAG: hypothetical protein K8T10_05390 [Candidatus Eremiobacteraeota bacterium]|nr:hypothetical protein [Candidatus Eremiobacteraeota bacterium]
MAGFIKKLCDNPIFIKDLQVKKRLDSKKKFNISPVIGYLVILLLPLVVYAVSYQTVYYLHIATMQWLFVTTCFLQVLFFCYNSIFSSYNLISREKEMRTYGNLISTKVPPEGVVLGKLCFAAFPLIRDLTILSPVYFFTGYKCGLPAYSLIMLYIFTVAHILFFCMLGLYFSARAKNSRTSHSMAIVFTAILIVSTLLIGWMLFNPPVKLPPNKYRCSFEDLYHPCNTKVMIAAAANLLNPLVNVISLFLLNSNRQLSLRIKIVSPTSISLCWNVMYPFLSLLSYLIGGWFLFRKTAIRIYEVPGE